METKPNVQIIELLSRVMEDVGAVRKAERNQAQNFNFRGIDAVVNAVSPALRKHGVIVVPEVQSSEYATIEIGSNRKMMGHARVTVTYKFYAPDGSYIPATVSAESMDSGDKATAKAMSVAFRTCLLQTLALPTDEQDPDHDVYERAPAQQVAGNPGKGVQVDMPISDDDTLLTDEKKDQFAAACTKEGLNPMTVAKKAKVNLGKATVGDLTKLKAAFNEMKQAAQQAAEQGE